MPTDTTAAPSGTTPVLTTIRGHVGHLRLNRPRKINALTVEMIATVRRALTDWESDPAVRAVVIDGAGDRGLCAGGDIAAVYDGIRGHGPDPRGFWGDEYRMNLQISQYPKPVVTLMDGITFGGGIGIGAHASVRIVTETSQLAMPETAIGLSPDVGGLYLLSRAPGELGTHAALTGARLGPGDAIAAGLADFYVPRGDLGRLVDRLVSIGGGYDGYDVTSVVRSFAVPVPASELWPGARGWMDECYQGDDAATILERLQAAEEPEAQQAAATLARVSPTAAAVTLRAIRNAAHLSLAEVLEQDLMLSLRFADHHDFPEGIRAQIIDKDRDPHWDPPMLGDVTEADVATFFAPGA